MILGERFSTDDAVKAEDYAKQLVLTEDTDVFMLLVPKVDVVVDNGFTWGDAEFYVTTCVDPRMIAVLLGVFSSYFDEESGMWGFTFQDMQASEGTEVS